MATFLQLCQQVASDSGTNISGTQPASVTSQTGRLGQIVRWTNEAWRNIQNARSQWRWMRGEFSGQTVAGTQRYASSALGVSSRFGEWVVTDEDEDRWTAYKFTTGVSGEAPLCFVDYDAFYARFLRGSTQSGRPAFFTVGPDNRVIFHPVPDAVYVIRGPYRKSPQDLTASSDTPEMPERFHDIIKLEGLLFLADHDEAPLQQVARWQARLRQRMSDLERDQLPPVRLCGALA
jgi:hypothetical protein